MKQTTLSSYFRSKSSVMSAVEKNDSDGIKKRSLSMNLIFPSKSPKKNNQQNVLLDEDVVVLSSDSESDFTTPRNICEVVIEDSNNEKIDDRSPEIIVYNLSPPNFFQGTINTPSCSISKECREQRTPYKGQITVRKDLTQQFNETDDNSLLVEADQSSTVRVSPPKTPRKATQCNKSGRKYFSPSKKRLVTKRIIKKTNLTQQFNLNNENSWILGERDDFSKACEGQDDKTVFLLSIINDYLKSNGLRRLLESTAQVLLVSGMRAVKPGMKLVCRLYWRQAGWYRRDDLFKICAKGTDRKKTDEARTIDNSEICMMLIYLVENGWLISDSAEDDSILKFDDYVKLLKKAELTEVCKELKLKTRSKRGAAHELKSYSQHPSIASFFSGSTVPRNNTALVLEKLRRKAGPCYRLSDLARGTLDRLYLIMYLGADYTLIRDKKLELALINEKINRETYPVHKNMVVDDAGVVFRSEDDFNKYYAAHKMYEDFLVASDVNNKRDIILQAHQQYMSTSEEEMLFYKSLPPWLRSFTPSNIYVKIMESGVRELKKFKTKEYFVQAVDMLRMLIAQNVFRQQRKAEWYTEMALILHRKLNQPVEASNVLLEGLKCTYIRYELKEPLRARARAIATQQNIQLSDELRDALIGAGINLLLEKDFEGIRKYKPPMENTNQRGKLKFEVRTGNDRSVMSAEQYCIFDLTNKGQYTHGEHWEGKMVTTMFFLLFWDIIYTTPRGVSGVYLSHYQRYPLDMLSDSFYVNRKALIEDRLVFIEECTDDMVLEMMKNKWEERPPYELSGIQREIGWDKVQTVATCMGARALAAVCRRLALDYEYARSGFPDLTMWNVHTNKISFIEVKTDSDKPSVKQLQWMQWLRASGLHVAFFYLGAHKTRRRARPAQRASRAARRRERESDAVTPGSSNVLRVNEHPRCEGYGIL